jgi:hypothetical protein
MRDLQIQAPIQPAAGHYYDDLSSRGLKTDDTNESNQSQLFKYYYPTITIEQKESLTKKRKRVDGNDEEFDDVEIDRLAFQAIIELLCEDTSETHQVDQSSLSDIVENDGLVPRFSGKHGGVRFAFFLLVSI